MLQRIKKNVIVFFLLGVSFSSAQEQTASDSIPTGPAIGKLPALTYDGLQSKYTYDALSNQYVLRSYLGANTIGFPKILSPEQYFEWVKKTQIKSYFKTKIEAVEGRTSGSQENQRNLLPEFYINNDFFETIFGGNEIEIIPSGSIAVDLGVLWQKNDNPSLSPRNRTNTSFDFDQRIGVGINGKIGERLQINANYDTEASFDFQNIFKLDYTPTEDDIIQSIEIGNVNMPLATSLIQGAERLFGVKTQLQFGKTTVTAVFSEQQSQNNSIQVQGGAAVNEFELSPIDYDEDRHFFLAQYFRNQYDRALENYPFINSQIQITRLEVWVTNRSQQTQNIRNIVALQDLGEPNIEDTRIGRLRPDLTDFLNPQSAVGLPQNKANKFNPENNGAPTYLNSAIRSIATVEQGFEIPSYTINQGFDYSYLENARKLEIGRDYQLNEQLGYISLRQKLSNDEVLGVAYQYTYNGEVYQVGEFANGTASIPTGDLNPSDNQNLVVKMLKSNITNVNDPIWDLMMKNIYATGAFGLTQEDFKVQIFYNDPSPRNYITPAEGSSFWPTAFTDRSLLNIFNFDRLNIYRDLQEKGDGFFDYLEGVTIDSENGLILFTKVEPFGSFLFESLRSQEEENYEDENNQSYNPNQDKFVFRDLYAKTKAASLQNAEKNRFRIKGSYKSQSGSSGIPIGAFNVARGSVRVTAGSRILQEGIDYTVDYQASTVQILDQSIQNSNLPIQISVEDNAVFGQQTRRFSGVNVDHIFNDKLRIGATWLNLSERPLTQKANFGVEPVNNTVYGFNGQFSTELPILTRIANLFPNVKTEVPSKVSIRAEFAALRPNAPRIADFNGETTSYIDDFEGAQAFLDIKGAQSWSMSSPPLAYFQDGLEGSGPTDPNNLRNGYGRAKLAWYSIDPIFYTSQRPSSLNLDDISTNATRRIFIDEIFPQIDIAQGQTTVQSTLDLAYYPEEKGPYNNDPNFDQRSDDQKWGGITKALNTTNFEQANIEYIQFWLLDPYVDGITQTPGELVFNIGNISEDILKDGQKQYENGLAVQDALNNSIASSWGVVPNKQSLVYAFDADDGNRQLQDLGYDGLADASESGVYTSNSGEDPALDNYEYYLNRDGGILNRYFNFNNPEGNAPTAVSNTDRGSTTLPDVEDVDRDLTMNTVNAYFEYRIPIGPNTTINDRFVTDIRAGETQLLPNGQQLNRRWLQYKIPLSEFDSAVGGITDFRSMSFLRMYLTGFSSTTVLRFATLDLVRGDWRNYTRSLQPLVDANYQDDGTLVDVNTVNVEENANRTPIPYTLPPGVVREQINTNNTIIRQNEQSLSFRVEQLEPGDARGVFKNVNLDLRQYKRLKMFMHAESIFENDYLAEDLPIVSFVRLGTDFVENYYQVELPLKFSDYSSVTAEEIWPNENDLDINFDDLKRIKSQAIANQTLNELRYFENIEGEWIEVNANQSRTLGAMRIGIKGNPSLGSIRALMIGVLNQDDQYARAEVWFNELRLAGFDNDGGWAAIAAMDANMADLANVTASWNTSTSGFGGINQAPNQRARADMNRYDIVSSLDAGKLLPSKWNVRIPLNYGFSKSLVTPEFDPVYEDLKLSDRIAAAATTEEAEQIRKQAEDYTLNRTVSLNGLRKERGAEAKANFFDIENFTFNFAHSKTNHRDFEIEDLIDENINASVSYSHSFKPITIAPLAKNDSILKSEYWKWLKEVNLNLLPSSISFRSNWIRSFNQQRYRQVLEPGVDALALPLLQQRNYQFNWQYSLNYNIAKSLKVNFSANQNSIVRNYFRTDDSVNAEEINEDAQIWDGFFDLGEPNRYSQQMQLNYQLPFDKIPFLKFMSAQYTYTSNFDWQRGGEALRQFAGSEINSVQNANTQSLVINANFQGLYQFLGLNRGAKKGVGKTFKDALTALKRASISFTENKGKYIPGYTQSIGLWGTLEPSLGFVFGSQQDVRFEAARNGYLTTFQEFNAQYLDNTNTQATLAATIQPSRSLTIDLAADRRYNSSYAERFQIDTAADGTFNYVNLLGNENGNFSITSSMIRTAFSESNTAENSALFQQFKENRLAIANRLAANLSDGAIERDEDGFPSRYGKTSQDVLFHSFFATYTGADTQSSDLSTFKSLPIPNWTLKYTGLMNSDWFKEKFQRFSLTHAYRSAFSINSFQTNLSRNDGLYNIENQDIKPELIMNNVVLNDQFNPLIRVDFEMKNSLSVLAEVKKDRAYSLSFDNNLLTQISGTELTLGLGYRLKDLQFSSMVGESRRVFQGDLNIKADISIRDNITILRSITSDNRQITSGQRLFSTRISADYALTKNINALFFYDQNFSKFKVSTAFPQQTINTGFSLRYNFGE